jgi:teichuronic acid biosynthesis glycosyltransferase TuaC
MSDRLPSLVVFTTLFPHPGQPHAGLFIRERMFRVGQILRLVVVAPVPWFPFQGLIRAFRPHFRPVAPYYEVQQGFDVYHPRFFSVPGFFKAWDGFFMALGSYRLLARLKRQNGFDIIDAHFAYPDGYAATLLAKWMNVAVTITLRGTEVPLARDSARRRRIIQALARAARVFAVAESLKRFVTSLGADSDKILVVGNGVDTEKFSPMVKAEARAALGIPADVPLLITVGGLVERKGFHRVIELLPELRRQFQGLRYLIVGGASAEGDLRPQLEAQVARLGLQDAVHFLGALPSEQLRVPLSAADVFVLATRNEGWANVLLEAMACGLPVVATDVGGNREVICDERLGRVVPFGDASALQQALAVSLSKSWDRNTIVAHAGDNDWAKRVTVLVEEFLQINRRKETMNHGG